MTLPQKIVGSKFGWVVVSLPKRFFLKNKLVELILGGGFKLCWVVARIRVPVVVIIILNPTQRLG